MLDSDFAVSVTRCWHKKLPKFVKKLPKSSNGDSFNLKIDAFQNSQKITKYFGLFL